MIYLISILLSIQVGWSQSDDRFYIQKGNLVSLKIVPKEKQLEVYFVGTKGATVDFSKANLTGKYLSGEKRLNIKKREDHYLIDQIESNSLELKVELEGKKEVFHLPKQ